jgi:uncharacterized SAM-binding protein YcdF (DUF218 family)
MQTAAAVCQMDSETPARCGRTLGRTLQRLIGQIALALVAGLTSLLLLFWLEALPELAARPVREAIMLMKEPIERSFRSPDLLAADRVSGIVVLGGHYSRFRAAARLALRFPEARVIASGASPEELAILAAEGLPFTRVEIDTSATNTFENACHTLLLANLRPGDRWLLVTSALHMPRAMAAFHRYGFEIEAFPIQDSHAQARYAAPTVLREMAALIVYRLVSWTSLRRRCHDAS